MSLTNDCIRDQIAEIRWCEKQKDYSIRVIEAKRHRDTLALCIRTKYSHGGVLPMDKYGQPFCLR